ncbi:hypothetical protein ACWCXH_28420 [Kitasatospora sp. NPDC001660]
MAALLLALPLSVVAAPALAASPAPPTAFVLGLPLPPGSTMTATRGIELAREHVAAFFDLHLKGIDQPVLDGPTAENPEISFHP